MATGTIRVGIGGWVYPDWRQTFYPPGTTQKRELEYASRAVTAIEINATFHRLQKPESFRKWRDATPEGFVFAVKGSRYITNRSDFSTAGESMGKFVDQGIAELGDKLGPINWQLAATKRFDADQIARLCDALPEQAGGIRLRHAIEPRHESFADPAFAALMHERGIAVVLGESPKFPRIEVASGGFSYARLMDTQPEIETGYPPAALDGFAAQAKDRAKDGDVFMFFISGAKERAPAAAMALIERIG